MYQSHSALTEPSDDTVLWRYMDFAKFFSILERRELFFPRLSKLSLIDPFEGQLTRPTVESISRIRADLSEADEDHRRQVVKHNLSFFQKSGQVLCVTCWHINSTESAAMWSLYDKSSEGIAIRTTFNRFRESLTPDGQEVSGGIVKYVDFDKHEVDPGNI